MKKILSLALGLMLAGAVASQAAEGEKGEKKGKRPQLTEEQQKLMKEIVAKYDEDKNGRLSPEERAKISKEDKEKMEKAGIPAAGGGKKGEGKKKKAE